MKELFENHIRGVMEAMDDLTKTDYDSTKHKTDVKEVVRMDALAREHEKLEQAKKEHIDEMNFKCAQFEYQKQKDQSDDELRRLEIVAKNDLAELQEKHRHEEEMARIEAEKKSAIFNGASRFGSGILMVVTELIAEFGDRDGVVNSHIENIFQKFSRH